MEIATLTMNPTIDTNSQVERVEADKKLRCEQLKYHTGDGGINVSRAKNKPEGVSLAVFHSGG